MNNTDKYRVQTRYTNPEVIRVHSGKTHRWVDSSAHHTKNEAVKACSSEQRVIKICTKSEFACLVDRGAHQGRRFNIILTPQG